MRMHIGAPPPFFVYFLLRYCNAIYTMHLSVGTANYKNSLMLTKVSHQIMHKGRRTKITRSCEHVLMLYTGSRMLTKETGGRDREGGREREKGRILI